jgi:hypothetical protein
MFELGGVAVLTFTATDTAGTPANGTTCTVTVTLPDGTITGPVVLAGTAGVYTYLFPTVQSGRHSYRFLATGIPGPGVGVGGYSDVFDVYLASPVALISRVDAKDLLRVPAAETKWDADLKIFTEGVTAFIDKFCGPMVPRQVTERHTAGSRTLMLRQIPVYKPAGQANDLVSITPVLTYGVPYPDLSLLSVDYTTGEVMHTVGLPFYFGAYDVSYWAGRAYIPPHVLVAAQVILKHWWAVERPSARAGSGPIASASDDTTILWGFAIPNRALEMLEPTRTPAGIR